MCKKDFDAIAKYAIQIVKDIQQYWAKIPEQINKNSNGHAANSLSKEASFALLSTAAL